MKIYLAGAYSRRAAFRHVRQLLKNLGHEVTSRWIDTDFTPMSPTDPAHCSEEERPQVALNDIEDIDNCEILVYFAESKGSTTGKRGGRHVEFGYGLAKGKKMVLIGQPENVFHYLPEVERFDTTQEFLLAIDLEKGSW